MPIKRDHTGEDRNGDGPPIADCSRRNGSDENVAGNPARGPCGKREHEHPEQVEPVLDPGHRSPEREHERAAEIETYRERDDHRDSSGDHSAQCRPTVAHAEGNRTGRVAHADSQACAAATSASTPVSRVGWMTGAKRGL